MKTIGLHCMQDSHSLQVLNSSVPRFFQLWPGLVTENQSTRLQRTLNKIDKLAILKVICWKLTKIQLCKVAEFYRRLYYIVGSTFLPSNLVSYLNSRPFFQHRWWIFVYCSLSKTEKAVEGSRGREPWKSRGRDVEEPPKKWDPKPLPSFAIGQNMNTVVNQSSTSFPCT